MRIDSVKTGLRFCPIFPELRSLLDAAWEVAANGAVYSIGRHRDSESILLTQLVRFPGHVVDTWLGHSSAVARKHYLQTTDAHWERAVNEAMTPREMVRDDSCGVINAGQRPSTEITAKENPVNPASGFTGRLPWIPPVGLEPTTHGLRVRCSAN